jgi:hypothetical protein
LAFFTFGLIAPNAEADFSRLPCGAFKALPCVGMQFYLFLGSDLAMPRQPLSRVIPFHTKPDLIFSHHSSIDRPQAMSIAGNCIATWSYVEAEMAIILGILLGAENKATVSVFNILRRSSGQREAIYEAAKAKLKANELELLAAILSVHKSLESDRNILAHGIIGVSPAVPDGILYLETNTQVFLRLKFHLKEGFEFNDDEYQDLYNNTWVYRLSDLTTVLTAINWMWEIWFFFLTYIRGQDTSIFSRLCGQSRIAEEIEIIRRKNTNAAHIQLSYLDQGG